MFDGTRYVVRMIFDCCWWGTHTHLRVAKRKNTRLSRYPLPLKLGQPAGFAARRSLDGVTNPQSTKLSSPAHLAGLPSCPPSLVRSLGTAVDADCKKDNKLEHLWCKDRRQKTKTRRKANTRRGKGRTDEEGRKEESKRDWEQLSLLIDHKQRNEN